MSSIDRVLRADALRFDLAREEEAATQPDTLERDGRSSRTLLKEGPLRVTLIVLAPGGGIPEHAAAHPITLQTLRGALNVEVGEEVYRLVPGELLAIDGGVTHHLSSDEGAAFLLTVTHL